LIFRPKRKDIQWGFLKIGEEDYIPIKLKIKKPQMLTSENIVMTSLKKNRIFHQMMMIVVFTISYRKLRKF